MSRLLTISLIFTTIVLSSSCEEGPRRLPGISGKAGEVGIVMDKNHWEGALGSTLRSVLAANYPLLPQPEPMFTLFNIPDNAFGKVFQSHRNLVLVQISSDISEAQVLIQQNVWSAPQIVITLSGPNTEAVAAAFEADRERIVSAIEQAERNRVITGAKRYEDRSLRMLVNESFGGSPYFPDGYALKKQAQSKDFIWISYETTRMSQGVFIYSYPYENENSFSKAKMLEHRNAILKREVPGQLENSYMITHSGRNSGEVPTMRWVRYSGRDFAELRGLWEVENDFMGGPFVSHSHFDPNTNRVLVLEAFVYNPRSDKRNYMRQTESILYSFEWASEQEAKE
ncbi:MAG: DUF4837 family protein [Bacteroidales bacterium]|nr:DUF4837 family protein [Bacteroidales bacterium]